MKYIKFGNSNLTVPQIVVGCMRINSLCEKNLTAHIEHCVELGLNFFDHADIYGGGSCENKFGSALKASSLKREDIILQSKAGIIPGRCYSSSKEYLISAVDGILKRLDTEYLDVFLIHRPDALVEPEEVAAAFDELERMGKVRHFGVSNHNPMQIELLKKYVQQDLVANQLQFSIPVSNMVASGMEVNMNTNHAVNRDGSVLDYCRLHDITIQAWSPFQYGFFEGVFIESEAYPELNKLLNELSEVYNSTPTALAAAWIMRHPAHMQVIAGTTNLNRMTEITSACQVNLSHEDWYRLYLSAGHILP